jgi:uncharacterized protein YbjT (DUF2867 family)
VRVLLTGANGFLGRHLLAGLLQAGHEVVPAVRRPAETDRLLPRPASIAIDLNRDVEPATWRPRLAGIDAVVNCAGILQGRGRQSIAAIHDLAPRALFAACAAAGVRRVIQISAISAAAAAGTAYASSKQRADDFLAGLDLDWVILRPSLVMARGAYGGTAVFRGLAALPVMPIPGDGAQAFTPIHMGDLTATVLRILATPSIARVVIDPVGPDTISLRALLTRLRRWLGFAPAPIVGVPLPLIRLAGRIGDVVGGTINSTAIRQLEYGNAGSVADFTRLSGIVPRSLEAALLAEPAQVQDRWHARLYFVRPALRVALALLWLASGAIGLLQPATRILPLLASLGLDSPGIAWTIAWASCAADLAIGVAVLARWRPALLAAIQGAVVASYTVALSVAAPALWLDPFGPLLKNLPILAAIAALAALEHER